MRADLIIKNIERNDLMKNIKRKLFTVTLCLSLILSSATFANAATHIRGCGTTRKVQVCGNYRTSHSDRHLLHTNVYCSRKAYIHDHYYVCANSKCRVRLGTGSSKICTRSHQYCPTEHGLCN